MDRKPLIVVSLCAVVLLVLGSLSNVVGYQSVKSTVNDSPLFQTRTQRATNQQQNSITSQFLGMGRETFLQFPIRDNRTEQLRKAIDIISNMDDTTFAQFTEVCIQRIQQDNTLQETNSKLIIRTLYLVRTQPDLIVHSFMNSGNQNLTSSNQYTICHWFPGCILIDIVILLESIMVFVIIFVTAIMSCGISCAASICCKNYNIKLNLN